MLGCTRWLRVNGGNVNYKVVKLALRQLSSEPSLTYGYRKSQIQSGNDINESKGSTPHSNELPSSFYYPSISSVRGQFKDAITLRIPSFREKFNDTDFSAFDNNRTRETYIIEGRIRSIRKSGKGMFFIDVIQDDVRLQVMAYNKLVGVNLAEFDKIHSWFKPGDYVSCHGFASRTKTGELTLKLGDSMQILTPCLNNIPSKLVDKGIINNHRVMNYLVNPISKQPIIVKSKIIQFIRNFFVERGFLEVQTPILSSLGTGANAQPFLTKFKNEDILLRVAPELWLKKLVIGGFDKIFEIGCNFRNEGIDQTHNPEFTSCEFYQTYTSLNELMEITETLFIELFKTFNIPLCKETETEFGDESGIHTFPRYEFLPTLEKITGKKLQDLSLETLINYYQSLGLEIPQNSDSNSYSSSNSNSNSNSSSNLNLNPANLLNNLSEIYLESLSVTKHPNVPVIIFNQPEILSPLAKSRKDSNCNGTNTIPVSLRFELFINGKEYVNAYEEENDPSQQLIKFKQQQLNKEKYGDNEMLIPDWEYVKSMEIGLPPTGGWGIGIDRLAMFISGADRIDQVLPFGNLRDVLKQ
ncbi:MSK1 [Candida oxycetoniae]|uniref:Lysyl-tRNA synthetase n=1 Tax=Candida oxycetoniae TaxID=497107 RepID=A0AAI9T0P4_9ASCO|nr:MSK1 [Candida oxycetoniae]KAI3406454.2 MSK1 [Candida oxycetoniae]